MKIKHNLLLVFGVLLLTGCTTQQTRPVLNDLKNMQEQAHQAYLNEEYELAVQYYLDVQKYLDKDPFIWFRLGNSYSYLKQPDRAIEAYRQAVFFDPSMSKAWHNMGIMQLRQSANTWTQMLVHTQESDPLYEKAERYSRDTLEVLNKQ